MSEKVHFYLTTYIQGKSIEDSIFLYQRLNEYLYSNSIPFNIATAKRFDFFDVNREQSHKAMTIYCADGFDFSQLCEDVYSLILDYKEWHDIISPSNYQHYAGGLFFRNNRDAYGSYIPVN